MQLIYEVKKLDRYRRYFKRIPRIAERYYNRHMTEGLTAQEANALRMLSFSQQLTQQRLAHMLGVDKSQVTRLVNKLEKEGYLTRETNPEDRREKLLAATEKADAVRAMDLELTNRYYEWLLSILTEEEREHFLSTLEKLAERARESSRNGFAELEETP